jgi:lipopolysaccharide biosynthesis regulator YciM
VELGETETAIEILKTAPLKKRNLDETLKQVHYTLAKAYERAGKKAEATKHLHKVYAADAGFMDVESELRRLETT